MAKQENIELNINAKQAVTDIIKGLGIIDSGGNTLKQLVTVVRELEDALAEMQKISDEPLSSLKKYQLETFNVANEIGSTAKDIQNLTVNWMRLGESLNEAAESAKATALLFNISEFGDVNEATKAMASISQAYKDLDKLDIVNKLNNIGSNYSIATDELADGLQNSAAVLRAQGNSLDQAIALITAGNKMTGNAKASATGVQAISLRIAGTEEAKDELSSLGEDVDDFMVQTQTKIQQTIKEYTAVTSNAYKGVDILDSNGNLRDTYSILLDISKVYKEIQEADRTTDTNRANALAEVLAGKNRADIATSILENADILESVYSSSLNSDNSAIEANEKYLDSLSGKIQLCINQLQELAAVALDSDFLKGLTDAGTGLLSIITSIVDKAGLLPALLAVGLGTKNIGSPKMRGLIKYADNISVLPDTAVFLCA